MSTLLFQFFKSGQWLLLVEREVKLTLTERAADEITTLIRIALAGTKTAARQAISSSAIWRAAWTTTTMRTRTIYRPTSCNLHSVGYSSCLRLETSLQDPLYLLFSSSYTAPAWSQLLWDVMVKHGLKRPHQPGVLNLKANSDEKSELFAFRLSKRKEEKTEHCQLAHTSATVYSHYYKWYSYAAVTTYDSISIRRLFDGRSTAYQRSLRSQWCNPPASVTLTYLSILQ